MSCRHVPLVSLALALAVALSCAPGCGTSTDAGPGPGPASDSGAGDAASETAPPGMDAGRDAPPTRSDAGDAGDAAPSGPLFAYASGYGPNIGIFSVDPGTGALAPKGTAAAFATNPSFLAINRDATNLYALSEAGGRVGAYAIDAKTGKLTFLNDVSSKGNGPAHVSVDVSGRYVFVANYGDGTVAVLPVQAGGRLGNATDSQNVGAMAHMILTDPTNQFVFVPCLGSDYIAQFRFDATNGKLLPNAPAHVNTASGAGPRHLAFHPNGKLAYLINETASTITAYALDGTSGVLTEIETKSTLPAGFGGSNTGAEVWVHPSGKLVFGSNRGHDSIVTFAIDGAGKMTLVGHTKTGGATPRDFTIDPTGAFLYVANQASNDVVTFKIDALAGTLAQVGAPVTIPSPSFVGVVRLP